jgi:hypothetical protein
LKARERPKRGSSGACGTVSEGKFVVEAIGGESCWARLLRREMEVEEAEAEEGDEADVIRPGLEVVLLVPPACEDMFAVGGEWPDRKYPRARMTTADEVTVARWLFGRACWSVRWAVAAWELLGWRESGRGFSGQLTVADR